MTSDQPGSMYYSYKPLPNLLALFLGLIELRGVMNLFSKLVGSSCLMNTKICLPNQ